MNAPLIALALTALAGQSDAAAAPGASASLDASGAKGSAEGDKKKKKTKKKDRGDQKWIKRWAPERNQVELGVFGGVMFPHPDLELYEFDLNLPDGGFKKPRGFAPEVGGRLAYFPARMFGLEAEGAVLPTETDAGDSTLMWAARGHLIAQIPRWSVTPFAMAGVSGLGVSSDRDALGNDIDFGFHFGGGVKIFFNRWVAMRLDVRDTLTAQRGVGDGVVHSPEVLLGLSLTLGRKRHKPKPGPGDRDGDGIMDPDDKCIDVPGVSEYDGCPIPDTDGDGILDPDDKCVDEPGVEAYDGCPIPDTDGDGILDPDDKCVDEPGVEAYDGCPIPDTDGDGIMDPDDKCVDEPETVNKFEDEDGCPDEIPEAVKLFTGVIEGIYFDTSKATIKAKSQPKLDKAIKLLKEYDTLRLEVSGHTDSKGNDGYNRELSKRRADSVKQYMVDAGIDGSRLETRGAGEDEPRANNKTRKGRAKNRRIEFKLLD
ncbi:MAG: OmpA family protein [Nannocystaceae bacterium]|nr:OmpA family protein [Nannocystaceae bacterium]